jgi:hypothetical protein
MGYGDHTNNFNLIAAQAKAASDEVAAVTALTSKGELLVGDGTAASHLDPSTGVDGDVLVRDSTATVGVKWGVAANQFDQSLNTTDDATFDNLTVTGTQTINNSVTNTVVDPLQFWGMGNVGDTFDSGWYASYNDGTDRFCGLHRVRGTNTFKLYTGLTVDPATAPDNVVDDTDPSFVPASIELANAMLVAANGNWTNIAPAAATTTWTFTLPDDKPATVGKSLVALNTSGGAEWADRVSSVSLGAGMTASANITTVGTISTDNSTLPDLVPLAALAADMFSVYDSANNVQSKATLAVVEASITHDNLLGYEANHHVDHSTINVFGGVALENNGGVSLITGDVTLDHADTVVTPGSYDYATVTVDQQGHLTAASTGVPVTSITTPSFSGLSGGPITSTGAISIAIDNAAVAATPATTNILLSQTTGNVRQKTTIAEFNATLEHNNMNNVAADEHVAHSGVSVIAASNSGLAAANNTLATNIGLEVDASNLATHAGPLAISADAFVVYDSNAATTAKITKANLEGSLNHNNLVNGGGTKHTDHALVSVLGGVSGLSVVNDDLTASIGLKQNINTLEALATNVAANDLFAVFQTSSGKTTKATIAEVEPVFNHNNLNGYVSNQHIDHSAVSITATAISGLDVGGTTTGDLTTSRALRFRPNLLTTVTSFEKATDLLVFHDNSAGGPSNATMTNVFGAIAKTDLTDSSFDDTLVDHTTVLVQAVADSGLLIDGVNTAVDMSAGTKLLSVDIAGTTALSASPAAGDEMLIQLAGGGALRQIDMLELNGAMNMSANADYDANDHVDHTVVLVQAVADSGLLVNAGNAAVDMTAGTKALTVDIAGTTQMDATLLNVTTDEVLISDDGTGLRSMLIGDLMGAQLNLGSDSANTTTTHSGTMVHKMTKITLAAGFTLAVAGEADEALGRSLYTFPLSGTSGVAVHSVVMDVALTGTGVVDADTPNIGIGSVVATGAVAVLSGTPTFENAVSAKVATDVAGATTHSVTTPSGVTDDNGSAMSLYLNVADSWAGADTVTATGTVVVNWSYMA